MPGIIPVNGKYALMFHYAKDAETARAIRESRVLKPVIKDDNSLLYFYDRRFAVSRVNLTDAKPEEGRDVIAAAIHTPVTDINYGLELLVEKARLERAFEFLPRAYQIFSEEPVPVTVMRVHNIDRLEDRLRRGQAIERYFGHNGLPYAYYAQQQDKNQQ
ncbi:hypothetical protein HYX02_02245 [Candidatus Woesearchaeota archaeon]|nr:hypothetical protein [Candidatus Woesearchaeota archaeon]